MVDPDKVMGVTRVACLERQIAYPLFRVIEP
jgi:hypothetical protein